MITQLLSKGFAPAIIHVEDRYAYYMALGKADYGDKKNIVQMLCDAVIRGYELLYGNEKINFPRAYARGIKFGRLKFKNLENT